MTSRKRFFVCAAILFLFIGTTTNLSSAGWFGPSNYEECVLKNMKGVGSDAAARIITHACRKKFPFPTPATPPAANQKPKHSKGDGYIEWWEVEDSDVYQNASDERRKRIRAGWEKDYGTPAN